MTSPYSATVALLLSAAALSWAIKRASIGPRPLIPSVVCWLRNSHSERKQAIGGSRCEWCGLAFAHLGSLHPMRTLYDRRRRAITREPW